MRKEISTMTLAEYCNLHDYSSIATADLKPYNHANERMISFLSVCRTSGKLERECLLDVLKRALALLEADCEYDELKCYYGLDDKAGPSSNLSLS